MSAEVILGDCLDVMRDMEADSIDSVVTDPPYGLSFMGKHWDHGVPGVPFWVEALRIAKPGTRLLAFGGTRTYHRMACAIEDAGWQIEDSLCWLYGSGFPKHKSKLKPAHEPIVMARKPAPRATLLNIDGCRIEHDGTGIWGNHGQNPEKHVTEPGSNGTTLGTGWTRPGSTRHESGRWPANVLLDEEAAASLDEMSGERGGSPGIRNNRTMGYGRDVDPFSTSAIGDTGGASRFFFVAREPNESSPNVSLNLQRAKAILWAWNPDLASTADDITNLSSQHAASVLSRAVTAASHGATQLGGLSGLSTSVTPVELRTLCASVIEAILSSAGEPSPDPQHGKRIPSSSRANGAGSSEPTGTTTVTIAPSTSGGSAVVVTLRGMSSSTAHGEADSLSSRLLYTAKASRSEREAGLDGASKRVVSVWGGDEDDLT